jgi:hypothetical protein
MLPFCDPCRAVIDENPFGVLFRRNDFGEYILCSSCRKSIWTANTNASQGLTAFKYKNPNAPSTCSVDEGSNPMPIQPHPKNDTPDSWICSRCFTRVHAQPRKFLGGASGRSEPADWWWCRACQQEAAQGRPSKDAVVHTQAVDPGKHPSKRQRKGDPAPSGRSHCLDHWLSKSRSSQ